MPVRDVQMPMLGSEYEAEGTHGVGDDDDVEDGYRRWISGYPDDADGDPVTWISGSGFPLRTGQTTEDESLTTIT